MGFLMGAAVGSGSSSGAIPFGLLDGVEDGSSVGLLLGALDGLSVSWSPRRIVGGLECCWTFGWTSGGAHTVVVLVGVFFMLTKNKTNIAIIILRSGTQE